MNARALYVSALSSLLLAFGACTVVAASDDAKKSSTGNKSAVEDVPTTDPAYRLSKGDEVALSVFNEPSVSTVQKIDNRGIIRLYLIGEINLTGKTVREAETYMEQLFVERRLLKKPMVSIGVRDYASREVTVLGEVNAPGKFRLPKEASSMEIVDLFSQMGGLNSKARGDAVKVTRVLDSGEEKVTEVDVEAMINPKRANRNTLKSFLIYPGDRIFVPVRIF